MYLSKLGMMSSEEATKSLTSALKGFHLAASDSLDVVDKLTKVDMNAAASAGDIASMLRNYASTATLAGLDLDQAIAMGTTILDVSQKDSGSVGNALRTVLSRYGNVKAGAYSKLNLDGDAETTENLNDIEKVLRKIGISMRNSQLDMRDFGDVLDDLAEKWSSLDEVSKNALATAFAGTRQRESFLILMENYDKYQNLLDVSRNARGTATTKYQAYQESYQAAQNRLTAAWESFTQSSGVIKILTKLVNLTADIVEWMPEIIRFMRRFAISKIGKSLGTRLANFLGFKKDGTLGGMIGGLAQMGTAAKATYDVYRNAGFSKGASFIRALGVGARGGLEAVVRGHREASESARATSFWTKMRQRLGLGGGPAPSTSSVPTPPASTALTPGMTKAEFEKLDLYKTGWRGAKELTDQEKNMAYDYYQRTGRLMPRYKTGWGSSPLNPNLDVSKMTKTQQINAFGAYQDRRGRWHDGATGKYTSAPKTNAAGVSKVAGAVSGAAAGIAAGVSVGLGIYNATLQNYDTYRMRNDQTGKYEQFESSAEAVKAQRTSNVIASALLGPVLGGFVGDLIGNNIAKDIDAGKRRRDTARETNSKALSGIKNFGVGITGLADIVKNGFKSVEDYNKAKSQVDSILKDLFTEDNKETRRILQEQLGSGQTVTDLMDKMLSDNAEERKEAQKQLEIATLRAEESALIVQKQDELYKLSERKKETAKSISRQKNEEASSAASGWAGAGLGLLGGAGAGALAGLIVGGPWGALFGAIGGAIAGGIIGGISGANNPWIEIEESINQELNGIVDSIGSKSTQEALDDVRALQEQYRQDISEAEAAKARGETENEQGVKYDDLIQRRTDLLNALNSTEDVLLDILAEEKKIRNEMNAATVKVAMASATAWGISGVRNGTYISEMSDEMLKRSSLEEIIGAIARSIDENGGFADGSMASVGGVLTSQAYDAILAQIKQDPRLNGLLTGGIYTLNEALGLKDGQNKNNILSNFAQALGIAGEQLEAAAEKWGNVKLSDLLANPAETREHITSIASMFASIASTSGLTGENLEKIISDFPELIQYLGNTEQLLGGLLDKVQMYREIYALNTYSSIAGNEGYFNYYKKQLEAIIGTESYNDLLNNNQAFGNATKISDILTLLVNDAAKSGITEEQRKAMLDLYNQLFDIEIDNSIEKDIINTIINYQTKMFDLQIQNLNEQKEALSEINNQREYEIKLIEAKLKLEEAQKEKRRVWREGVGWTYEADQSKIEEAEQEIENVTNEKRIAALEMEIEQMSSQKEVLENLATKDELENLRSAYNAWTEEMGLVNSSWAEQFQTASATWAEILKATTDYYNSIEKISLEEPAGGALEGEKAAESEIEKRLKSLFNDYSHANDLVNQYIAQWQKDHPDDLNGYKYTDQYQQLVTNRDQILGQYQSAYSDAKNKNQIDTNSSIFTGEGGQERLDLLTQGQEGIIGADHSFMIGGKRYYATSSNATTSDFQSKKERMTNAMIGDKHGSKASYIKLSDDMKNEYGQYAVPDNFQKTDAGPFKNTYGSSLDNWGQSYPGTILKQGNEMLFVNKKGVVEDIMAARRGSLGIGLNPALVNEDGTEAIVTPMGTVTALPTGTGVVPADITKNLWQLGALAPEILRSLGYYNPLPQFAGTAGSNTDNSLSVGVVNMTVNPDSGWDVNAWVRDLKQVAALNKNNK